MSEPHAGPNHDRDARFWYAVALSFAVLALSAGVLWWKADGLASASLGDLGSFISGVASAVALVWIVTAYHQQNHELHRQLREFAASVDVQRRQAAATEESIRLAADSISAAAADKTARPPAFRHGNVTAGADECRVDLVLGGSAVTRVQAVSRSPDRYRVRAEAEGRPVAVGTAARFRISPADGRARGDHGLPYPLEFRIYFADESNRAYEQYVRVDRRTEFAVCGQAVPRPEA